MIQLAEVKKVFNEGRPNELTALHHTSLSIETGSMTIFRGPSGSGKTTLLSLIGCMTRPTAGRIMVKGEEVSSFPEPFLAEIRRETFGFIFQQLNLIRGLTLLENIMIPAYPSGDPRTSLEARARELLGLFGLTGKAHACVENLSGGEAQRAAIARALINSPSCIIADEPTAHLDSALSIEFMEIMEQQNRCGRTVIIASHDPLVCDHRAVHRTFEIRDGRLSDR